MCVCVCSGIWDTQAGNELLRTRALCLPETFGILIISQERRVKIDSTVWKKQQLTRRDVTAHSAGEQWQHIRYLDAAAAAAERKET